MKIIWSPTAGNRIREIIDYISNDNPDAALNLIDQFEEKVERLKANSQAGKILEEINNEKIREIVVHKNYGVIYEINNESIEILTGKVNLNTGMYYLSEILC